MKYLLLTLILLASSSSYAMDGETLCRTAYGSNTANYRECKADYKVINYCNNVRDMCRALKGPHCIKVKVKCLEEKMR